MTAALAAEACCDPSDLRTVGVHLSELSPDRAANPLRRRYPLREESLQLVTMGAGVVVSATPRWMPWVTELFRDVGPDEAFSLSVLEEGFEAGVPPGNAAARAVPVQRDLQPRLAGPSDAILIRRRVRRRGAFRAIEPGVLA